MNSNGIPVMIEMTTIIKDGSQKDTNSFSTKGHMFEKGRAVFLRFLEPIEGDEAETVQTVKIQGNEMTVLRKGAISMNQRFIPGTTTEGMYQSPYGPMAMRTKTKDVLFDWNERTGNSVGSGMIRLRYSLQLQGSKAGDYDMRVKIKEDEMQ
ncbi:MULTISPECIES: DUF1934 domain-containing protein [Bacillaceae]|uniref:DUF1934 domain-containing protein n=1 Tax=Evansella alkalicola TaxID=745819 RepID=A0ABS6K2K2_9BACI|nr:MULTISPECIES: DUF1934 domain-containing protein [Bacillaceae]MBU9724317.1 DUF1934 domain-containing protein [Bacillus alkalicola]